MSTFEEIINELHDSVNWQDSDGIITINNKRVFEIPDDYNTVIGYEGDINTQIITFQLPDTSEGHKLSLCQKKELKWKNLTSGAEGVSDLIAEDSKVKWIVPPEVFLSAGNIEFSISLQDFKDEQLLFSWNTATCTSLTVASAMSSVGYSFPPKDEILVVDKETKNIIAPKGYNNIVCNYGDVGMASLYFLIDRYLGKKGDWDILDNTTTIYLYVTLSETIKQKFEITSDWCKAYTTGPDSSKTGSVFIEWQIPETITSSEYFYPGLSVALVFIQAEEGTITKRWISNWYSDLRISKSVVAVDFEPESPGQDEERINEIIEHYIIDNEFIISAEKL